jgi:hypothetical protein
MKTAEFKRTGQHLKNPGIIRFIIAALLLPLGVFAQTGSQKLEGHIPAAVKKLQPVGHFAAPGPMRLAIGLPPRDPAGLKAFLHDLYDPHSPNFRHYLTPQQFTARFGPSQSDYDALKAFARANGLNIRHEHPNRVLLDVEGSVADIEKTFHVSMQVYQHPTEKRRFHAPDREPSVNLRIPLLHIGGLDDFALPQPSIQSVQTAKDFKGGKAGAVTGSGPLNGLIGPDLRKAYASDSSLDGSGQSIGLLQFDGYISNDIAYYENLAGLPYVPLTNVLIDGASGSPSNSGGLLEVPLDIDMAISIATNISKVMVYIAPNTSPFEDILSQMANDNAARQLSSSWYARGAPADPAADVIFQQMAAQGQSFFSASGDSNAFVGLISFPQDSPYIIQVGGTTLTTAGAGGAYVSETVWNKGNGTGSSGGISTQYSIPDWQTNISMYQNQGSVLMRNTPDIAMAGDHLYVRAETNDYTVSGTSCSAPMWASFAALANQLAASNGLPSIGFINPVADIIGTSQNYNNAFHDITTGNNTSFNSPNLFYAVQGYDLCTGWGTPNGQAMIKALAFPLDTVSPASGFTSIGKTGGPFTVTSQSFTVANTGSSSLLWSLNNPVSWLTAAPSSGTLTAGGTATVNVSLNTTASNLAAGVYTGTIWFTNLAIGITESRQFTLNIGLPPVITTQPTDLALLAGATASFNVGFTSAGPCKFQWLLNGSVLSDNFINTIAGDGIGTFAGDNLFATNAAIDQPYGVALDGSGNIFIADQGNNRVRKVDTTGTITTVAGNGTIGYAGDGALATNASLNGPYDVTVDNAGNLFIADVGNNVIRKVDANGTITTVAGNGHSGYSGDGGSATNARLDHPFSVCADASGNLFISDSFNNCIRKVDQTGNITTVAGTGAASFSGDHTLATNATVDNPFGVAVDAIGDIYIADLGNNRIRMVDTNGIITTVAGNGTATFSGDGGQAISAGVDQPYGLAVDASGNVFVSDIVNNCVRRIGTNGIITTVAGNRSAGFSGDGGPATQASVNQPYGIAVSASDNLVIADRNNNRVRSVNLDGPQTLVLPGVSLNNAGSYSVIISNEWGSVTSSVATLAISSPPVVSTQPQSLRVTNGNSAAFSISAAGTGTLAYQWRKNGTNLSNVGTISGVGTANLAFSATSTNDSGSYTVVVTNTLGSLTSAVATLTVAWPPAITVQPQSVTLTNGSSASFTVAATGAGPISFLWQSNGVFLADGGKVSGSGTTNLVITAAAFGDAASYAVVVSNSWGTLTSSVASLTVFSPPFLTKQPQNLRVTNGNPASLSGVAAGTTPLFYQWRKNQTNLVDGAGISGSATTNLVLASTTLSDSGSYDLLVTNAYGSVTSAVAALTVSYPPVITNQPVALTVTNGDSVSFFVGAAGASPLSYFWQKNHTNLVDGGTVSGSGTSNLVLGATAMSDAGNYTVIVSNVWGFLTSSVAALTVVSPPIITNQPANLRVTNGNPASLTIAATGTAPIFFQWRKNQTNLVDGGTIAGAATTNLVLSATTTNDSASYDVVVTNAVGAVTSAVAALTVAWPPVIATQPQSLAISNGTPAVFSVSVSGASPFFYQWQKNQTNLVNGGNIAGATTANLLMATVSLADTASYTVIVSNIWGVATSSVASLTVLAPPVITAQPQSASVNYGDAATFNVTAVGTAPMSYFWVRNHSNLLDGGNISGSATNSLLVAPATTNDAGTYSVVITNAEGSVTSSPSVLSIVIPPILITQQPLSQSVVVGSPAGFSVTASSSSALNYQWQMDGTNLPQNVIITVAGNGQTNYSGDGGPALSAALQDPYGIALDGNGNIFIADFGNHRVRKVDGNGVITTVAGNGTIAWGGDRGQATNAAVGSPVGLALWGGNLFISDEQNDVVRKIDATGVITTVAGNGSPGYLNDGVAATNTRLKFPYGIAADGSGNLYIADLGNDRVRKVDASGIITTIAGNGSFGYSGDGGPATNAMLNQPYSVAVDGSGNLYIADFGNNRIRKVDSTGTITTVAGGSSVPEPYYVALDGSGNLIITDLRNEVHKLGTNGVVTTIAGNGAAGFSGDGNSATNATLDQPFGVAADSAGNLYISDTVNNRIRKVGLSGLSTLTFSSVAASNAGSYDVIISNPGESVTSAVVTLTITAPPVITNQPLSLTVTNGTSASFSVVAGGGQPLSYFWQKNQSFLSDGTNITGSAATNLVLASASATDAGSYTVVVSNVWGALTSGVATLSVVSAPVITSQPQGLTVTNGNSASLAVSAAGSAPLFYRWQKNQVNLSDAGEISGSSTTNLVLAATTTNDAASYTVIVSNAVGAVTSSVAVISVAAPPVITSQPGNFAGTNGGAARFNVAVSGATPLAFQWRKNQTNLADGGEITGSLSSNLVLSLLSTNDAGAYSVTISNVWGSVTSGVATLAVLLPPLITAQPASLTVTNGRPASFAVSATGSAPLSYQWQKNQHNLADGANVSGSETNTLLLSPTTTNDAASYTVIVSNAVGVVTSAVANLSIFVPSILITRQPAGLIVNPGATATFSVGASSIGALSYQWRLNGTNLPENIITTVAGNGATNYSGDNGPATNASLQDPFGVAVDGAGNIFFADTGNNRVRKIDSTGAITTVAGNGHVGSSGDGGPAANAALNQPQGVAVDVFGNLFITDLGNNRVRRVSPDGVITTVAGNGANSFSGDGGQATNASLSFPYGVGADSFGNLFISDLGNNRIRKVSASGIITTVAGNGSAGFSGDAGLATNAALNEPFGVAVDDFGNIFIADTGNNRVRKVDTNGIISSFGSGIQQPYDLGADGFGNIVVSDLRNNSVHKVDTNGVVTTVAGDGSAGYSGDGGPATGASLNQPYGVAVDPAGNLFIGDTVNNRIREVGLGGFPVLTLTGVTSSNAGSYTVVISNPGGSVTSSVAVLTVALPPSITNQPQSLTVTNGGAASLSVAVSGTAPFTYQWLKNQTNLTDGANISGSASSNLQFLAAGPGDAGSYTVIVSNAAGSVTSAVAILTVYVPQLLITQQPTNETVVLGQTATFTVVISPPVGTLYQWSFNGSAISGATNSSLVLTNVQSSQAGTYSVFITNTLGSLVSTNALLSVVPDHFTWSPIPSPRFIGMAFPVSIQARDANNNILTGFTGSATLDSTNGVPISWQTPANFAQGVWSGTIIITQAASGLALRATDGPGYVGLANPINVLSLPTLSLSSAGNTLQFVWPNTYTGFILESSPAIVPQVWTPVQDSPIQVGGQFLILLQAPNTLTFYRLHYPGP